MALSLAAIPLAGLLEVHSWVNAVPVRGAQDLISIAPTYECVFGELLAWLLAACLAAPPVAIPFTGASALRVTITVVSIQEFNTSGSFPLCSSPRSRFQLLASSVPGLFMLRVLFLSFCVDPAISFRRSFLYPPYSSFCSICSV